MCLEGPEWVQNPDPWTPPPHLTVSDPSKSISLFDRLVFTHAGVYNMLIFLSEQDMQSFDYVAKYTVQIVTRFFTVFVFTVIHIYSVWWSTNHPSISCQYGPCWSVVSAVSHYSPSTKSAADTTNRYGLLITVDGDFSKICKPRCCVGTCRSVYQHSVFYYYVQRN